MQAKLGNLNALIADLAGYNSCGRIRGHYVPLAGGDSSSGGQQKRNAGIIRIDSCSTAGVGPEHLRIELSGIGWQWISRKKEQLGATFTVNDYATFAVKISMVGTFDMAYDKQNHILTIWFVPTQPVDTSLRVLRNVEVDTESLWSSIVGIAGSVTGKTPEQRARATIREKGDRLFQSKLSQGMTLIVDLCTGRHYFKLGSFPAGQLPESAEKGRTYLVNSRGALHKGGLLIAGPFDSDKPIVASFRAAEGIVHASIVCEDGARNIADAYVNGRAMPGVRTLAQGTARPGRPVTLRTKAGRDCRVVIVMTPQEKQSGPVVFDYLAYQRGEKPKPVVDCK